MLDSVGEEENQMNQGRPWLWHKDSKYDWGWDTEGERICVWRKLPGSKQQLLGSFRLPNEPATDEMAFALMNRADWLVKALEKGGATKERALREVEGWK